MQLDLSAVCLGFLGLDDFELSPLFIPIVAVIAGATIAITAMFFHHRKRELWHQTARLALEKGQPLPPMMDIETPATNPQPGGISNDFRTGLILIATGAALYVFLGNFLGSWLGYVGAIPGFIGAALLLHALLAAIFQRKKPEDRPPQA